MIAPPSSYQVHLDIFEGPLDLLLYLIEKEELQIEDISITQITTEFLLYLQKASLSNIQLASSFSVMATQLMLLKSELLLQLSKNHPVEKAPQSPKWDLIRQLLEYRKFKEIAFELKEKFDTYIPEIPTTPASLSPISSTKELKIDANDLWEAFQKVIAQKNEATSAPQKSTEPLALPEFSVKEKSETLLELLKKTPSLSLQQIFLPLESKLECIYLFLALLDLIKNQRIIAKQNASFGEVLLELLPF